MPAKHAILILGASYGSLLGTKLLAAGHDVTLVCQPATAAIINREGTRVRLPIKGRAAVDLDSRTLPGTLAAAAPDDVDPSAFDLVALAMQEPQYSAPGVRTLMTRLAEARLPCMSLMNMPPPPYLARIPGTGGQALASCYLDPELWAAFDPELVTLCSPDPQAFRPPDEPANILTVTLPTNFKVARFGSDAQTALLRQLDADIEAVRHDVDGEAIELPVKLKLHDSLFVPLAKWAMLLTGNYRCVTADGPRSIRDAVHSDLAQSREVYDFVTAVCLSLGAAADDLVPFDKYAAAAQGLTRPSSAARALYAKATHIERVDALVRLVASQQGLGNATVDETVDRVDRLLAENARLREGQPT